MLHQLLKERPIEANISHKEMPTWDEHVAFVRSHPYKGWYLIQVYPEHDNPRIPGERAIVGSIYLTHQREVGIFILQEHQNKGYGQAAIWLLKAKYPGKLLANVAPGNHRSQDFFKRIGARQIQVTFEIPA